MSSADYAWPFLPYVRAISPYQPGKPISTLAREMGIPVEGILKLASNENPLGMSPRAREALSFAVDDLARYPDGFELREALARHWKVDADCVVLGNGSNDVLDLVARVFLAPGYSAVMAEYAFAVYPLATLSVGAESIVVAARDFGHDLEAMLAAVRADTRVVWIANPNNPTGTFLSYGAIYDFLSRLSSGVMVVLDEAYNEYLDPVDRVDTTAWLADFPNLVITRTFSKIYGLAGLRVGYALAAGAVAEIMNRVRQPFNCNHLALTAALAALSDEDFVSRSYLLNRAGKQQLIDALAGLGLEYIRPYGNFVTFRIEDAVGVNQRLLQQGVIVRPLIAYDLSNWLRVTVGGEQENDRFLRALVKAR